jgi:hypothetical protein
MVQSVLSIINVGSCKMHVSSRLHVDLRTSDRQNNSYKVGLHCQDETLEEASLFSLNIILTIA